MLGGTATRYLKQTVVVYSRKGVDDYGAPTFKAESSNISCRIDSKKTRFLDKDGREVISEGQIIIDGDETVTPLDKIKLPDNTYPIILGVEDTPDVNGNTYYQVIYI